MFKKQQTEAAKKVADSNKKKLAEQEKKLAEANKRYEEISAKFSKASADLKTKEDEVEYLLNETPSTEEVEELRRKNAELLSQQESAKEEIAKLRKSQYSEPARNANAAYDFYLLTKDFVEKQIAPLLYNETIIDNQDNKCGEYYMKACNMIINAAGDLLKMFKVKDIIDAF